MSLLPTQDLTCPPNTGRLQAHNKGQHEMRKSYIRVRVMSFQTRALRPQHVAGTMVLDPHRRAWNGLCLVVTSNPYVTRCCAIRYFAVTIS